VRTNQPVRDFMISSLLPPPLASGSKMVGYVAKSRCSFRLSIRGSGHKQIAMLSEPIGCLEPLVSGYDVLVSTNSTTIDKVQ
jgi:hypothetical protein